MSKSPKPRTATVAVSATVAPEHPAASKGAGEFVLYTTDDGLTRVEMRADGGSLWLSQAEIATLFQTTPQNITQHVKAIYAEGETTTFFRIIQNKLHFAVSGQTAAEIIRRRADHTQPNMGLTSTRKGQVQKADVGVAKNYLDEREVTELNRIVTMWLDFAEDQAARRKEVFLKDWAERLDAFLSFNERQVLVGAGKVSHKQAVAHAQGEYEQFAAHRRVALETEGAAYAIRMLGTRSTDEKSLSALDQMAKRLTKKKGGRDAA